VAVSSKSPGEIRERVHSRALRRFVLDYACAWRLALVPRARRISPTIAPHLSQGISVNRCPPLGRAIVTSLMLDACAFVAAPRGAEGVPNAQHVIVVIMENHAYDTVCVLPYTASLIAVSSSFAHSYAITHPSQPNYLALWGASTMGVTNDNCPSPGSPYSTENLGHACEAARLTWKAYCEGLPAVGSTVCDYGSPSYARRHAPWTDWSNLTHTNEVPFTQFASDTAARNLPRLAYVVPNNCDNTHDCSTTVGDNWLAAHLPGMIRAVGPNGLVILTWDEDDGSHGNHILTVFAGPLVRRGYGSSRTISHYTVVRTICAALGLKAFGYAASDSAVTDVWVSGFTGAPPDMPAGLRLDPPLPDPSFGAVRAVLHLPAPARVDAAIFDTAGRRVAALAAGPGAGSVTLAWDGRDEAGRDAGSGVFFLRVRAAGHELTRRVVRVR
jgi:acid phosphatase